MIEDRKERFERLAEALRAIQRRGEQDDETFLRQNHHLADILDPFHTQIQSETPEAHAVLSDPLLASIPTVSGLKRLRSYVIVEKLGSGGMGSVYLAYDTKLRIPVAIKFLSLRNGVARAATVSRVKKDHNAARITHQHIARALAVDEDFGLNYIIMEYVAGKNLREVVNSHGALPIEVATTIIFDVVKGLTAAHEVGVVHRDIKPSNILLSCDDDVKLADLGLASTVEYSTATGLLTRTYELLGTPPYMPPEQWSTSRVDERADIWSIGSCLFFLLAGEDAFTGTDPVSLRDQICEEAYPNLLSKRQDVPRELLGIFERCTARNPGTRYPNAQHLEEALGEFHALRGFPYSTKQLRPQLVHEALIPQIPPVVMAAFETDGAEEEHESQRELAVAVDTTSIELVLNREFNSFSEQDQENVVVALRRLLCIDGEIRVIKRVEGSVRLTLEMDANDAERLLEAARAGHLRSLGVVVAVESDLEMPLSIEQGLTKAKDSHATRTGRRSSDATVANPSTTRLLLRRWHSGDGEALGELVRRHLSWIRSHVLRRMRGMSLRRLEEEDVVQDTLLDLFKHGPRFLISDKYQFRALIAVMVENNIKDKYDCYGARRRATNYGTQRPIDFIVDLDLAQESSDGPRTGAQRQEDMALIRLALEFLDPEERQIVLLRQGDERSFNEIGEEMGIEPDTARMKFKRALPKLADALVKLKSGQLNSLLEEEHEG